jgi:hypothetical protein
MFCWKRELSTHQDAFAEVDTTTEGIRAVGTSASGIDSKRVEVGEACGRFKEERHGASKKNCEDAHLAWCVYDAFVLVLC